MRVVLVQLPIASALRTTGRLFQRGSRMLHTVPKAELPDGARPGYVGTCCCGTWGGLEVGVVSRHSLHDASNNFVPAVPAVGRVDVVCSLFEGDVSLLR